MQCPAVRCPALQGSSNLNTDDRRLVMVLERLVAAPCELRSDVLDGRAMQ